MGQPAGPLLMLKFCDSLLILKAFEVSNDGHQMLEVVTWGDLLCFLRSNVQTFALSAACPLRFLPAQKRFRPVFLQGPLPLSGVSLVL